MAVRQVWKSAAARVTGSQRGERIIRPQAAVRPAPRQRRRISGVASADLELQPLLADDLAPFVDLVVHEGGELLGAAVERDAAHLPPAGLHLLRPVPGL